MGQVKQEEKETEKETEGLRREEILDIKKTSSLQARMSCRQNIINKEVNSYLKKLTNLTQEIWNKEEMAKNWSTAITSTVHKGHNAICSNY